MIVLESSYIKALRVVKHKLCSVIHQVSFDLLTV